MDERLLDVFGDFPDGLDAARKVRDASWTEHVRRVAFTNANLTFEDVDDLVGAEDPRERTSSAIPETRGEERIRRLAQLDRAGNWRACLDPARLDRQWSEIGA